MKLSILICSVEQRVHALNPLVKHLQEQIGDLPVEILTEVDGGNTSIGQKRTTLLHRAKGEYIAFVDDDDWVPSYYVADIMHELAEHPDIDCLGYWGVVTTDGHGRARFVHSLDYNDWFTYEGVHYRCPNHLNPVARELGLQVGFPALNHGEDHEYSSGLLPLLETHAMLPRCMYWYRYRSDKRTPIGAPPDNDDIFLHLAPPPAADHVPPRTPSVKQKPCLPPTTSGTPSPQPNRTAPSRALPPGAGEATGSPCYVRKGRGGRKKLI